MARYNLKNSFTRGEITPLAHARVDIDMYQAGAETLRNFYVLKEGGIRRRPGTRYRGAAGDNYAYLRFMPFVYGTDDSLALEWGPNYVRFWQDGLQIADSATGLPYQLTTPYDENAIREFQWTQSGDTIYIAFGSMTQKPQKLVRTANDNWAFTTVSFTDGPYLPINDKKNKVVSDVAMANNTTVTFTWDSVDGINGGLGLLATDVGRAIRVQFDGKWSWGNITEIVSTVSCKALIVTGNGGGGLGGGSGSLGDIDSINTATTTSYSWRLGAFSDTTGYPSCVEINSGRVFWASTPTLTGYIAYSYAGYPETFTPSAKDSTVTDAHGGALDILAGRADKILWLHAAPKLQIGGAGTVRTLGSPDSSQIFSPRNIELKSDLKHGAAPVRPVDVGPSSVHANRFGTAVHDLYFDYQLNSLVAPDLSVASDHLLDTGIVELHYAQEPNSLLWGILGDGTLVSTTISRYEKIVGWGQHALGGSDAYVVTGCVIPSGDQDQLYLVVRRTVNGQQVQYVETLERNFVRGYAEDAFFVDCGLTVTDVFPLTTITGLSHLEGETVALLADGFVLPSQPVVGGTITLPNSYAAFVVQVGLPYTSLVKLLRTPEVAQDGPRLGHRTRIANLAVDLYETAGLQLVSDMGETDALRFRSPSTPMNLPQPLYTGLVRAIVDGGWESHGQVSFSTSKPLPATIRAVNIGLESEP